MTSSAKRLSPCAQRVVNQKFEKMLPQIQQMALGAFRGEKRDLREELAAEVIGRAFVAFVRLAQQGKADPKYAVALAMFAARQVRSGRRLGAKLNIQDVSSEYCGINKGVQLRRIDHYDRDGEWKQLIIEDKRTGPAETAAFRIDFASWLKTLTPQERRVAGDLAYGDKAVEVARKRRLSESRVSQLRKRLKQSWDAFVGEPVGDLRRAAA